MNSENKVEKKADLKEVDPTFARPDPNKTLRTFIELVTSELFHYKLAEAPIYTALRSVSRVLNKDRNEWAFKKAKEMLDTAIAIVVAYGHSDRSGTDTQSFAGISQQPELWTREMLQPTILALVVSAC